jgi:myosin heavy subunit
MNTYKKSVPEEAFNRLMKNNERFKNEVISVRYNPIWKEIENGRKIAGSNLVEKFRGQNPGQPQLRQHILNNPRASELMLGTRWAGKPKEFGKTHELTDPYLKAANAETRALLSEHRKAGEAIPKAQETIKRLSPVREKQIKMEAQSQEYIKELQGYQRDLAKLKKAEKELLEKKRGVRQAQKGVESKKQTAQEKAEEQKNVIKEKKKSLKERDEERRQTLKEKMEHEQKVKDLNDKISKVKGKLMKIALSGIAIGTGTNILSKIF